MSSSMLRVSLVGCALAVLATGLRADEKKDAPIDLKVGDPAPAFEARDDRDRSWKSADVVGKKWLVVYFYPGDFTPGCMAQAKAFNAAMNKLTELGVEVVGVSGDSVLTHAAFKAAMKLDFTLLADEAGAIAMKFGVPVGKGGTVKTKDADGKPVEYVRAGTAARWTFIIGKDGKIAYKNTKVVPADDAKKVSEFIAKAEGK